MLLVPRSAIVIIPTQRQVVAVGRREGGLYACEFLARLSLDFGRPVFVPSTSKRIGLRDSTPSQQLRDCSILPVFHRR